MYPEGAAAEGASLRDHLRWFFAEMDHPPCTHDRADSGGHPEHATGGVYQATSEVLLNRQNLSGILSGVTDPNTYYQPERLAQTQAELARVPEVGQRVITAAGLDG